MPRGRHRHALMHESAPYDENGRLIEDQAVLTRAGPGHAKCRCGQLSPLLRTATERKQWHREHKAEMERQGPIAPRTPPRGRPGVGIEADFYGECMRCGDAINPGDRIIPHKGNYIHVRCQSGQDDV